MMMKSDHTDRKSAVRTISLWICCTALAVVYSKRNTSLDVWKSILNPSPKKHTTSIQSAAATVQSLCRAVLRYAWKQLKDDMTPTQHRGSCQCGSVQFVVFGPKTLYVLYDVCSRKIVSYRHARIHATALTWDDGGQVVRTYKDAHYFCPNCGVPLAHVKRCGGEMTQWFINIDCLDGNTCILRPASSRPKESVDDERSLNVPWEIPVEQQHIITKDEPATKQSYSPTISALDDSALDDGELSTDDRIVLPHASASSVASVQSTEELATTAYRLRKALSSHSSVHSKSTTVDGTAKTTGTPTADGITEYYANASPVSSVPELAAARSEESSTVPDADTLRRFLTKHVS